MSTAPDPFSLGGTPDPALPWSHLTKEEWVEFKRTYGDYWALHLGRSAAWVFRRLLYHSNYLTGECFPGHRHLARARKVSTKTIQRATVELLDVGLVDKVIPRGERSGRRDDYPMSHNRRTNLYVVNYVLARTVVAGKLTTCVTTRFLTLDGQRAITDPRHPYHDLFLREYGDASPLAQRPHENPNVLAGRGKNARDARGRFV